MHRLAALPGDSGDDTAATFVQQAPAPALFLSSADTDLLALAALQRQDPAGQGFELRALNLACLAHPAQIDHYLSSTAESARVVIVRLLGGRGHWSYGLEALRRWAADGAGRQLIVVAGTAEDDLALAELGTIPAAQALALAACLREGGTANLRQLLLFVDALLKGKAAPLPEVHPSADPAPHDWRQDSGERVGVILYRAMAQAGDLALADSIVGRLRGHGLCPRALWVSSLRDAAVQRGVADLLAQEQTQLVLCCTGFASVQFEDAALGAPLWKRLNVPVLQLLCSITARHRWQTSSIGLGPLDLSLQVVLPELDGRITTRVGAFKETDPASTDGDAGLGTALLRYQPDPERLDWIVQLCGNWIRLRRTKPEQRRLALVLANYPCRDARLANGVGLDTPASVVSMLQWLQESGHVLGAPASLPRDGEDLIAALLRGRTNDPESGHRPPLAWLDLATYESWYASLPSAGRQRLEAVWGQPAQDRGLELMPAGAGPGFAIHGRRYGSVVVLIQPDRGYDRDPAITFHSPDLPPTHAYLAQYLWLRQCFGTHLVVHVGKHGNLEWLPGKAVGLSDCCFPEWAIGPLPHLYPFIVNDPGEGSQAKRRAQAVIIDHLTPPLGRAGLHGGLLRLEALLDEFWEARQLGGERVEDLRCTISRELEALQLPLGGAADLEARFDAVDGYLCELKEAQIRIGLHRFGQLPSPERLAELALCLARPPQNGQPGLTQALARDLCLDLDPWCDPEDGALSGSDRSTLRGFVADTAMPRHNGDAVAWLERQALELIRIELGLTSKPAGSRSSAPRPPIVGAGAHTRAVLQHLRQGLLPALLSCADAEREAFLTGVSGGRIEAGPSGAPSRGRSDLLPTGRNFYSVDLRGLPTEAAWDLGRRSAELLLELHLQEEGNDLRTLALSVWGTATMRNGGEDIAQALALLGVRPCWDGPTRRLVDLEVIPLSLLGRPRVDVTLRISGLFRDAFPQLVAWFNKATALVAALSESEADNPLAAAARREGHAARVYGSAPGAYGAGLQALIDSGQWEQRSDLAEAYLCWSSWRYDSRPGADGIEAAADRAGLEQRLKGVELVLHNQDNREHDLLDSDDYYQFQGGLSAAVEQLRGESPALWIGDHSRFQRPRLHPLERELDKVLRSRLLNPRWIEAMAEHGYKGGFEMAASLDYLFAYGASTGRVPDWSYGALSEAWLESAAVLETLRRCNPWALRDMAERLLEAHNRGLWRGASESRLDHLRNLILETEAQLEGRSRAEGVNGPARVSGPARQP